MEKNIENWKIEFEKKFIALDYPVSTGHGACDSVYNMKSEVISFIQNLLDQHGTARYEEGARIQALLDADVIKGERRRIIEQIREEERARIVERLEAIRPFRPKEKGERSKKYFGKWGQHNMTLDQAIDIINDNK